MLIFISEERDFMRSTALHCPVHEDRIKSIGECTDCFCHESKRVEHLLERCVGVEDAVLEKGSGIE